MTITEAKKKLSTKEVSPEELFSSYQEKIDAQKDLNAFLQKTPFAIENTRGALAGIPVAIKDNMLAVGSFATAGSKMLEKYESTYDATVVKKLKTAGATILGKTNLDEFAMGASTENSAYGPTKNPHDPTRVPGGSSGGSAAAVAADLCVAALGSDTGGSIRQPASFCGIVGLRPTYGAVSRHGLIALASSLDQIGPLTKTVTDARTLFNIIKGEDVLDATSSKHPEDKEKKELKNTTIGVPKEYFELEGLNVAVKDKVKEAIEWFKAGGATIKEVSLPNTQAGLATYYVLVPAEASSNLARYDGMRYGASEKENELWAQYKATRGKYLGPEPIRRILMGTYVLSAGYYDAYYKKAVAARKYIRNDFEKAFGQVDVLMTPTTPTTAFKIGEKSGDPLAMYAADVFTVPASIAGAPAMSIPCGTVEGLPVGLQIIAPWHKEGSLFALGEAYEKTHNA